MQAWLWCKQESKWVSFIIEFSRGVAQPGSAPALGAGGRRFKSYRPDQFFLRFQLILSGADCAFEVLLPDRQCPVHAVRLMGTFRARR